ncbi:L-ribulose-5-phosphate 4-epimerase [Siphonobacter sp. BAB-5404]|nr:L-ribulose-5-phosphate 4-epimerase [Siphonobacter sp. SORGH_AS_0500]
MSYKSLKEECYEANMMLPKLNLVVFTFGNASVVDREKGVFAIKPSGVPYEFLKPEDIVICDYEAQVVEGTKRPSSGYQNPRRAFQTLGEHWRHRAYAQHVRYRLGSGSA